MVTLFTLKRFLFGVMLVMLALALGAFTTSQYVQNLSLGYLERGEQLQRHLAILNGHAGNPWQYHLLAPYLIKSVMAWCRHFEVAQPVVMSFIGFRVAQDSVVMLVAYAYYRRLGLAVGPARHRRSGVEHELFLPQHRCAIQHVL